MIICDNRMYGTIAMHSYMRYPQRPFIAGTKLTNPDFAAWGRSLGAEGITIGDETEVAEGIARAFAVQTRPVVVHCLTSAIQMSAWRAESLPQRHGWPGNMRSARQARRHRRRNDAQIAIADREQAEAKLVSPILHAVRKFERVETRLDRGVTRLEPAHVAAARTEAAAHIEAVRPPPASPCRSP
jgi:hypothetical protein